MTRLFESFKEHDRFLFPDGIVRVTTGKGGEAILITAYKKTALVDCGMAYCAKETAARIKEVLGERNLDFILITHSHYDHIGALSYLKTEFPEAKVLASQKASKVFASEGAKKVMKSLSDEARLSYSDIKEEVIIGDMDVDIILSDEDEIDLGGGRVIAYETKGHTDCCLTYLALPMNIMFTSESTGVLGCEATVSSAILKSFDDCKASANKCMSLNPDYVIIPHYGIIPKETNKRFFKLFLEEIEEEREAVKRWYKENPDEEAVLKKYCEKYWTKEKEAEQTFEAFLTNAKVTVGLLISA